MQSQESVSRTLRRQSNPINYAEQLAFENSSDSGIVDIGDVRYPHATEPSEISRSPESLTENTSIDTGAFNRLPPEASIQAERKRVSRACDYCRHKKCKVLDNCAEQTNFPLVHWNAALWSMWQNKWSLSVHWEWWHWKWFSFCTVSVPFKGLLANSSDYNTLQQVCDEFEWMARELDERVRRRNAFPDYTPKFAQLLSYLKKDPIFPPPETLAPRIADRTVRSGRRLALPRYISHMWVELDNAKSYREE